MVRMLVYFGYNPEQADRHLQRPIHLSSLKGKIEVVRDLCNIVRFRVFPRTETFRSSTALFILYLFVAIHSSIVQQLYHRPRAKRFHGSFQDKVDIAVEDENGATPLTLALKKKQFKVSAFLKQVSRRNKKLPLPTSFKLFRVTKFIFIAISKFESLMSS